MDTSVEFERFQYWLTDMDDAIERFLDALPHDIAAALDLTPQSLVSLESWVLDRFPDHQMVREEAAATVLDGAARYVGEVFRRQLGATWTVELKNPKDVFYDVPALIGMPRQTSPICPLFLVTASTDRRTGGFIKRIYDNSAARAAEASSTS